MTIRGNVVDAPTLRRTKTGVAVANFRVASTQRRWDREQNAWIDGSHLYVTVTAWRGLGENAADSLHRGDAVVVHGRYYQREYVKDEVSRTAYELDALTVGHDLARGTTVLTKVNRQAAPEVETDELGPADVSGEYLGADDVDFVASDSRAFDVDTTTGEVHELATV